MDQKRRQGDFVRTETKRDRQRRVAREEKATALLTRRKQMFAGALAAEKLGPHPGRVEVRVEARIYDPISQRYAVVPGWKIELVVETEAALMGCRDAAENGIKEWINGRQG